MDLHGSPHPVLGAKPVRPQPASCIFHLGDRAEEFGLHLGVGDELARFPIPAHCHHIMHEWIEKSGDLGNKLEHPRGTGADFHFVAEELAENARKLLLGGRTVSSEVIPAADGAKVVNRERKTPVDVIGVDSRLANAG